MESSRFIDSEALVWSTSGESDRQGRGGMPWTTEPVIRTKVRNVSYSRCFQLGESEIVDRRAVARGTANFAESAGKGIGLRKAVDREGDRDA